MGAWLGNMKVAAWLGNMKVHPALWARGMPSGVAVRGVQRVAEEHGAA